ncbi:hypothetical protein LWI28_004751 [Acer negundo]|uniref:Protein FAR1-RELATED SEQUENCE n=1 Tax=Acer negundo TaxID=4023 RepID=A0AAD5JQ25_ACENE|nr:hypothetical protein LWI28_004751 [Acer negundo]
MGIDLEQPSGEYYKEDNRPNVNVNMVNGDDEGCNRGGVIVNSTNNSGNNKENTGPNVSGTMVDGRHKVYARDGLNLNSVKNIEPREGMDFESKEEAFSFYKEYAMSVGFATIIKASRRSRISGKFIDAKFVCTRYGNKREPSTAETAEAVTNSDSMTSIPIKKKRGRINRSWSKTDCKASMHVKRRQEDGRWVIRSFIKEHNHEIFPDQAYYFRGHRNLDLGNSNVDALHAIRDRTKRLFVAMSRKSGGYKKLENQKGSVTNQLHSAQHLALDEGNAQVMLDHFINMQDENPNFFYAIDLNEEQRLRNVFWVDAKSRLDFGNFGDVVYFDTAYIKNEYKLPFAPFIGVNHHFQFLLLGCALLADETKSTYVWLMRAWLRAMGGHAPNVILTDQDKTLKEAIAEVFPDSRHCFCLWHIFSKIPEKLSFVMRHDNFMTKFNKCIFKSCTNEQFEKRWWKIVDRFNLRNDMWFQSLYEDREHWIPTFMKDIFLAGMSTTQRSESINSFFDKYIQRKTTLKEFLDQYKAILQEKCEEEAKADFETRHKQPGLKSPSPFGKQMASLYTHAILRNFRHVMIVLQMFGVHSIPSQYILTRWTKDAKSKQTGRDPSDVAKSRVQRYNDLCQLAFKLGDEGSLTQESYSIVLNALEEALRKCESVNNSIQSVMDSTSPSTQGPHDCEDVNQGNSTSKTNQNNSLPKKRQVHPETEVITIGMHDSWQQMGHSSLLRAPALDCSYEKQERMQGMEQLHSRSPTLDGYFSAQQIVQGMGQLNSMAPSREDYYGNQHNMQGLGQLNSIAPMHDAHYITQQRMHGMGQLHFRPSNVPNCFNIQDGLQDMDQSNVGPSQLHGIPTKHR